MNANPDPPELADIRARFADGWAPAIGIQPGWHSLLARLHAALIEASPDLRYCQIKPKYGGLRVYVDAPTPATDELTIAAEMQSLTICERCGGTGHRCRSAHGWLRTLCPACAALLNYTPVESV